MFSLRLFHFLLIGIKNISVECFAGFFCNGVKVIIKLPIRTFMSGIEDLKSFFSTVINFDAVDSKMISDGYACICLDFAVCI